MTNLQIYTDSSTIEKVFLLGFLSFMVSVFFTPMFTNAAYSIRWWKAAKTPRKGQSKDAYQELYAAKAARNVPTMAGAIIVLATLIVTLSGNLSRSQTWLPLAALVGAGLIGLADDIIDIRSIAPRIAGQRAKIKALSLIGVALLGGWWFYDKLGVRSVDIPFAGAWHLGWLVIPLFVLIVYSSAKAVNITDGVDGLAGGLTGLAFTTYAVIALIEKNYGLSGFCMTVAGALVSYTWFNIYPARFIMGNVGSFALGTALGVVAMLTDTVFLLPVIGIVFVIEIGSVIVQFISKQLRGGKKIFLSSPIHRHFELTDWPEAKVTMRFWVVGQVAALVGLVLFINGGP
jgi:phospho-N-acetylmuramoyl-pentapeptide-transferase